MSDSPRVTVLMSVHNGEPYLSEALASVTSQSFADFELVVIDDGSTDHTADILDGWGDHRLRIVSQPQIGLTQSLIKGLSLAHGEYVARMDADDIAHADRLRHQVALLDARPSVGLVGTWADIINEHGRIIDRGRPPVDHEAIAAQLLWDNAFFHSTIMFRASVIAAHGGYDESLEYSQDYNLYWRVGQHAELANIPIPLLRWRRTKGGISVRKRAAQREYGNRTAFAAVCQSTKLVLDYAWFARMRQLWFGDRHALEPRDGLRLAEVVRRLPQAAGRTVWIDVIALAAAARPGEAWVLLASAWQRFPRARQRLFHPKRVARIAGGPPGLRATERIRQGIKGY